uniref:Uncharacterized protein n=1 Tax=Tanacetum cinerariifolium TaxID=118510 RepID=A0A6L2KHY4_TANCI|nr:hypothetical protein [Tanacetum cinerariifolium]
MSIAEAEYVSLSACCAQVIWMRTQLLDYGFRTKYQLADLFTKSLPNERFEYLVHMIVFHMAQQILLDHPLSYGLTTTADVPVVYLQQLWMTFIKFLMETSDNPFVAPVNIETIVVFMNKVGYQGVVDKVSAVYRKNLAQPCILDSKLIIVDLMKKFPKIPQRIKEDYHSIKDDIPLDIHATNDFKKYKMVFMTVDVLMNQPRPVVSTQGMHSSPHKSLEITIQQQKVVEGNKDDDDFKDRLEPRSHKDTPKHIDDDDDEKDLEKVDEEEGGDMGSLETRTEKIQTPIPTPSRSPRTILSSDKNITQKLTKTPCIAATIIEDRDAFHSDVPDLVSQDFNAQAPKIIKDLFKKYVQRNVIQVHPTTTTSTETTSLADLQRKQDDDIHSYHDDHQKDDAPPKREKRVKRNKASKSLKPARGSSFKHSAKDFTTYVSKKQQQQEWDA